jgi:hypothetical protein
MRYMVSADLGQAGDPTAVCVTELVTDLVHNVNEVSPYELHLKFMKALQPHEDYEAVAEQLVTTVYSLGHHRDRQFSLTGAGDFAKVSAKSELKCHNGVHATRERQPQGPRGFFA